MLRGGLAGEPAPIARSAGRHPPSHTSITSVAVAVRLPVLLGSTSTKEQQGHRSSSRVQHHCFPDPGEFMDRWLNHCFNLWTYGLKCQNNVKENDGDNLISFIVASWGNGKADEISLKQT